MTTNTKAAGRSSADRAIYSFTTVSSGVLYLVLLVAPVLAIKFSTDLGFSNSQIGGLLSIELGAFALATLPSYYWLSRVDLRKAAFVLAAIAILGNISSTFLTDFGPLAISRVFTAFATGSIFVIVLSIGGRASNPTRSFGLMVLAQTVVGAIVLFAFPAVYTPLPIAALYWTIAILELPILAVARMLPGDLLQAGDEEATEVGQRDVGRFVAGLGSILLLFTAGTGAWTFAGQIAIDAGISTDTVSVGVAISTVVAIVGPIVATVFGESSKSWIIVGGAYAITAGGLFLMLGLGGALIFIVAVTLLNLGWNALPPYLFASVGLASGSPHALSTINLLVGIGFALGPALAGQVLATSGSQALLLGSGLVVALAGLLGVYSATHRPSGKTARFEMV